MSYPIKKILTSSKTVAIVGLSSRPDHPSHEVAQYLLAYGYEVIPINPAASEILGRRCYASLRDLPAPPDVVDVFLRAESIPTIVEDAIAVGARAIWMQLGLKHPEAARRARQAGLMVVMDRCMKREHQRISRAAAAIPHINQGGSRRRSV